MLALERAVGASRVCAIECIAGWGHTSRPLRPRHAEAADKERRRRSVDMGQKTARDPQEG
jgi:hypothetical protein